MKTGYFNENVRHAQMGHTILNLMVQIKSHEIIFSLITSGIYQIVLVLCANLKTWREKAFTVV